MLDLSLKGTLQKLGKIFASSQILMNIYSILKNSFKYRNKIHTLFDYEIFNKESK